MSEAIAGAGASPAGPAYQDCLASIRASTTKFIVSQRSADPDATEGEVRGRIIGAMRRALTSPTKEAWESDVDESGAVPSATLMAFEFHCLIIAMVNAAGFDRHDPARQESLMVEVQRELARLVGDPDPAMV